MEYVDSNCTTGKLLIFQALFKDLDSIICPPDKDLLSSIVPSLGGCVIVLSRYGKINVTLITHLVTIIRWKTTYTMEGSANSDVTDDLAASATLPSSSGPNTGTMSSLHPASSIHAVPDISTPAAVWTAQDNTATTIPTSTSGAMSGSLITSKPASSTRRPTPVTTLGAFVSASIPSQGYTVSASIPSQGYTVDTGSFLMVVAGILLHPVL
jgi:hypothetical protein